MPDSLLFAAVFDASEREINQLSEAACYLLLHGITPSNADAFFGGRSVKHCARRFRDFERHCAAKALADSLAHSGSEDEGEKG